MAEGGANLSDSVFFPMHPRRCTLCERTLVSPHVLSCLHVLCEQCLMYLLYISKADLKENDYTIKCPECYKTVTVGLSDIGPLQKQKICSSDWFFCPSCVRDTNSFFSCDLCHKQLCLSCLRDHSFETCPEGPRAKKIPSCKDHNKEFKYFCSRCKVNACIFCMTKYHSGHPFDTTTEAETVMRNDVQRLLDDAKDKTNQGYEKIFCLLEMIAKLRNEHKEAQDSLHSTFDSFMKFFNKSYHDAAEEINEIYSLQETRVKKLLQDIETYNASISNSCKTAKQLLMESDKNSMTILREFLPVQLSVLNEYTLISFTQNVVPMPEGKTFQMVVDDFHQNMKFSLEEFSSFLGGKSTTFPDLSKGQSKGPMLPTGANFELGERIKIPWLPISKLNQCGGLGRLDGEFASPTDLCLGPDDEIIIADQNNHRIQIFHKDGTFKAMFGEQGKMEGQLSFPTRVAFNHKNKEIVVADLGIERWRLQVFSIDGIFITKLPSFPLGSISVPSAMEITCDGYIIILDKSVSLAVILNDSGDEIHRFNTKKHISEPSDFVIHGNELFICDYKGHLVAVYSMDGTFQRYIGGEQFFYYPAGIHVDENGVFVSNSNDNRFQMTHFSPNGDFKAFYKYTKMKVSYCQGLKMNSDGCFVTVSRSHHCMFIIEKASFAQDL